MVKIRKATVDDAGIIAGFQTAMAWETESFALNTESVTNGVKAVFSDKSKGQYFVAELNRKVIASLLVTSEWSDWRNKYVWWIQSVYILPEHRGKKIFSRLYNHVKNLVEADNHAAGLRLYVDLSNKHALKVYKAVGMNGDHYRLFEWMKE